MRVLHWVYPFSPGRGGQSIFIERIALGFADLGHDVALAMEPQTDENMQTLQEIFGAKVKRFHLDLSDLTHKNGIHVGLSRIASVIDEFRPDVIHIHNLKSGALAYLRFYLASKGRDIRTVCTMHDLVTLHQVTLLLDSNSLVNQLDMVVAPSEFMIAKLGELDPNVRKHFTMIYNGVPKQILDSGIKQGPLKLLFAAELNEHKGGVYLLNAWAKIFKEFPDVTLTVAGDGDAREFLTQLAQNLGLGSQIEFVGWLSQEQINLIFDKDCILIIPSMIGEAFGLIAAEAAMARVPVIANDIGALPEIVVNNETGITVPIGDTQALALAIKKLISDPKLRIALGQAAQKRAISHFSMESCINAYRNLFTEVTSKI